VSSEKFCARETRASVNSMFFSVQKHPLVISASLTSFQIVKICIFQRCSVITRGVRQNMRRAWSASRTSKCVIASLVSVDLKILERMLRGVDVAYSQDTLWQSGFRNNVNFTPVKCIFLSVIEICIRLIQETLIPEFVFTRMYALYSHKR